MKNSLDENAVSVFCFYCGQQIASENLRCAYSRVIQMNHRQYAHPECYEEALNALTGAMNEK